MKIYKISELTCKRREMDLPVTKEQIVRWIVGRELIQNVFPHLSPDEKEFLMTGATPEEWKKHYGEED